MRNIRQHVELGEHLGIASALLDQADHRIAAFAPALVAGDPSTSSLPTKVKSIRDKAVAI